MKDSMDSTAVRRAPEPSTPGATQDDFANRKLIRPSLSRAEGAPAERRERPDRPIAARRPPPPEQTHAENFYYQKQIQSKTPMVFVLKDGEELRGTIEWYDRNCIKVNRFGGANLLVYKPAIKYIYKESENDKR